MNETQFYIFDYGGTLDTAGRHWGRVLWDAYQHERVPVSEQQFREAYVFAERTLGKNPIIQSTYTFHRTLDTKLRIEFDYIIDQKWWQAGEEEATGVRANMLAYIYNKVKEETGRSVDVLRKLKQKGARLVLVSNFYGNMGVVLSEFGFDGLFDSVVESAVAGVRKPDPRIFALGVEALGVSAGKVTVVGDSMDKDIVPARKAGCRTVWLRGQGWTDNPVDESQADRVITRIDQLLENENNKIS